MNSQVIWIVLVKTMAILLRLACPEAPLPSKLYCKNHLGDVEHACEERLDTGVMTRGRRKQLGLDVEELTTDLGCRC